MSLTCGRCGRLCAEQLITPKRWTARFSNRLVRSLLEGRSPTPGEFDHYMASPFSPRVLNLDDWREVAFLTLGGLCLVATLYFATGLVITIVTSESEQVISGPVTLSTEWLEFTPRKALRPAKQYQDIVLDVDPAEGLAKDNLHLERMELASGVLLKPEMQLIDSQGNVFDMEVSRSPVPSRYNNGLVGYVSNLPQDRIYIKARVRSNAPVRLIKIVWHCVQGK
jgi:hypothetical protein